MGCQKRLTYCPMASSTPKDTMAPPIQYTPAMYITVKTIWLMISEESHTALPT